MFATKKEEEKGETEHVGRSGNKIEQGRIQGNLVADSRAGAVMLPTNG